MSHLSHLSHALRELRKFAEAENVPSLAMPKLATGIGGFDWKDVLPLIQQPPGDLKEPVYVYSTFVAGVQAEQRA